MKPTRTASAPPHSGGCDAACSTEDIDHISAHGSSTPQNDRCETGAIILALGEHARRIPVNSMKSMLGHPLSAASALEIVGCALTLQHGFIPPTINFNECDPECDLDYVPNCPRNASFEYSMSNSFAFGGLNAVLAFRRL